MKRKGLKKLASDFKDFAFKDTTFSTAIGIMLGIAIKDVTDSLINDILMPPIELVTSDVNFQDMSLVIGDRGLEIRYGSFLDAFITFLITAFILFIITKFLLRGIQKRLVKKEKEKKVIIRKCPYCFSEIHKEATRCPNCTSKL